ncbi:MAG: hypothetical protein LBM98_11255 [Oscillospiraceae bacterium]|jgi:hypothetical protein|nr:hypothetical protein [Oscillospiraceae bacterium]
MKFPTNYKTRGLTIAKWLLGAFAIAVYLVPIAVYRTLSTLVSNETSSPLTLLALPVSLMLLVCLFVVLNIITAAVCAIRKQTLPFGTALIFKLALIPFYAVNFAVWFIGSVVFHTALVVIPMLPFIIAYTYFTILATSAYAVCRLLILRPKGFVKHCVLQFIFVLDIIDTIILAVKYRKNNSAER